MRLRETPADTGSELPPGNSGRLPETLTLLEAAALTKTDPDALWQRIRSSGIPFTLISARKDRGTSVLLSAEDLARAGLLPGRQPLSAPTPQPARFASLPLRLQGSQKKEPTTSGRVAHGRSILLAAVGVLIVATLVPSVRRIPVTGLLEQIGVIGATDRRHVDASSPRKAPKGTSRSGTPSGSALRPRSNGPRTGTARSGSPVTGPSTAPQGASSVPERQPSNSLTSPVPGGFQVPAGIPSNCARDVTADLSRWILTVPNNSMLMFPMGGCYRIDGTIRIVKRTGLTFQGNGTTFSGKFHTQGDAPHWGVYSSSNITFRDVIVRGANPHAGLHDDAWQPRHAWEAAWEIDGSDGVLLDSVQAYDVYGDFVTIEADWVGGKPVTSRDITIRNSHFERNGRMGIGITDAENVTISNNYIGKVRHALLDLEPEQATLRIDNVRFVGNRTGGVWLLWIANGGRCNAAVSNIYVADNVMEDHAGMPLFLTLTPAGCAKRGPFIIERNTLIARSSPRAAFDFRRVHDIIVRNNRVRFIHDVRTRVLVTLESATRISVLDNEVTADPRDKVVFVTADPGSDYVESGNIRF